MDTLRSRCDDLETMAKNCTLQNGAPFLACEEDIRSAPMTQWQREKDRERRTKMNAERDPFILKLPPEIASHVFILSMGERDKQDVCQFRTILPTPFLLGAVCGGWRALARATPELWSTLVYTFHNYEYSQSHINAPQLISDWLVRSGSLPLTLRISDRGEGDGGYLHPSDYDDRLKLIIDVLNLHSERWCEVDFALPTHYVAALRGTSPPKNLRKLRFSYLNVCFPVEPFLQFTMNTAPGPMTVAILGFHLDNINISWDNLVHLYLSHTSLDGVMKVLRDAPLLETCSLIVITPMAASDGIPRTIIRHPRIRVLLVSLIDIEIFAELLDWLVLPSLEFCDLNSCSDDNTLPLDTVISLIKRSACSLKMLRIWYDGLESSGGEQAPMSEDMERLLRAVPHLRYKFGVHGLTCFR